MPRGRGLFGAAKGAADGKNNAGELVKAVRRVMHGEGLAVVAERARKACTAKGAADGKNNAGKLVEAVTFSLSLFAVVEFALLCVQGPTAVLGQTTCRLRMPAGCFAKAAAIASVGQACVLLQGSNL